MNRFTAHGLLLSFLLYTHAVQAQFSISVTDAYTLHAIANAEVLAEWNTNENRQTRFVFITDELGIARIDDETIKQNATFRISAQGYVAIKLNSVQLMERNYKVLLEAGQLTIDEITISASKFREPSTDVAKSISVVPKREIERLNPLNSADLLEKTGQVFVQRSQLGGGSPVLRGFEANRVLLVVDGIRLNNAIYRSGHLHNVLRVHPMLTERVEVVFGAGSVMYGSDALGGVVYLSTIQPAFSSGKKTEHHAAMSSGYQSAAQAWQYHLQYSVSGKKIASLTAVTFSEFSDLRQGAVRSSKWGNLGLRDSFQTRINANDIISANDNNAIQKQSGYRQVDILQKIRYAVNEHWELGLNLQYSNTNEVPRYDRLSETDTKTGRLRFAEWYYGPELRTLVALQLTGRKRTLFYNEWRTTLSYQRIHESRHNRTYNSPLLTNRYEKVDVIALNSDAQVQVGKNELRYGLEYQYNYVSSDANRENINTGEVTSQSTRYPDGGSHMNTYAFYITANRELNRKWILNSGLRLSAVHLYARFGDNTFFPFLALTPELNQFNTQATYNAGVVYKPVNSLRMYINYATGFRAPNVDDAGKIFESAGNRQVIIPNPNLKSEYSHQAEVGFTLKPKHYIYWQFSTWYTWLNDAISIQPASLNGSDSIVFQNQNTRVVMQQNVQSAYLYGYSSTLRLLLHKNAFIYNTLNYTYGRIKTDTTPYPLDHIPPIYGRTGFIFSVRSFTVDCYSLHQGVKNLDDYNLFGEDNLIYATKVGMPAWYTLNIATTIKLTNQRIKTTFVAGIENITDNYYRTFASGISGAGRNVFITLRLYY